VSVLCEHSRGAVASVSLPSTSGYASAQGGSSEEKYHARTYSSKRHRQIRRPGSDRTGLGYNRTDKGKLVFLLVRDGSGFVQCVAFKGDLDEETFDRLVRIPQESSVIITGPVRADGRAPGIPGGYEVGVKQVEIIQEAGEDYPMALKEHGVDFALDNRHLWIRMPSQWAILRVRATVMAAVREWLDKQRFHRVGYAYSDTCRRRRTTTLFETEYFDEGKAYLAQTGQLYNEANIFAFGRVYCYGRPFARRNPRRAAT